MTIKKIRTVFILFITCAGLVACSSKPGQSGSSAAGVGGVAGSSAQSYGAAGSADFVNEAKANAGDKSKAPANQTYYFAYDNSTISAQDDASIVLQAHYLMQNSAAKIRVDGNTDERGSREYNIALGYRRAQAVAHLLEQQGVSPKQISIVSYGKEQPIALGHNESAWAQNRRVNLTYEAY